jgi:iron complex transport system substrate-binding protein
VRLGIALCLALSAATLESAPQRIVSIDSCADQLLLTLAPRERIAALSHLATRPDLSNLWREARGILKVRGSAEEVLALAPDLVLAGAYRGRHTVELLRRFGVPVVTLARAKDFADVRGLIERVAEAIGEEARGEAALAAMDRELARLASTPPRTGAYYRQGGYTSGSGTLTDAVMEAATMVNVAVAAGLEGSGYLPLERLLVQRPQWLITSDYKRDVPTLGSRALRHPALRDLAGGELVLPGRLTSCGGGWNIEAVRRLAALPPAP